MKQNIYLIASAMILVMAACQPKPIREEAPHWSEENSFQNAPLWQVEEQTMDLTCSMNIIASVNTDVQSDDRLAALCDNVCLGVCQPVDTKFGKRFYLCIYQPAETNNPVTLAYYNAKDGQTHYWRDTVTFTSDAVLGAASMPYELGIDKATTGFFCATLTYSLTNVARTDKDELAIFCGNECRQLLPVMDHNTIMIPLRSESEQMYLRYYSDYLGHIYTSEVVVLQDRQHQHIEIR